MSNLSLEINETKKKVHTTDMKMSIGELINLYKDGEIIIDPEFQRLFVWENSQKSKFIESILIELNEQFHHELSLKINHSNFNLFHDSADQLGVLLKQIGGEKADVIISSLPLANFPSDLRDSLLDTIQTYLKEDGYFVQFQYSLQAKRHIKKRFPSTKINFTPLNIPPAFVYSCQKKA